MSEYLSYAVSLLTEVLEEAEIMEDRVYIPSKELVIKISVERADESGDSGIAVLYFWLFHSSFEEPLFETTATLGSTAVEAVNNAVKSFYAGIFTAAYDYLSGDSDAVYVTDFFGEKKEWDVVESDLVMIGHSDRHESFWELIKGGLEAHIGNKHLYYIKVYTSKQADGEIVCECRVNNNVSRELASLLEDYVLSWNVESLHSQKQFFFISQRSSGLPYPYSREQIEEFTSKSVRVFADCDSEEKYENLIENINKFTNDYNLAIEFRNFMPEMCAENHFNKAIYAEYIDIYKGDDEIRVYKDRFTPYNWIRNKLISGFIEEEYPEKAYGTMITVSATYNVLQQIEEQKTDTDTSKIIISTGMSVPVDYKVR